MGVFLLIVSYALIILILSCYMQITSTENLRSFFNSALLLLIAAVLLEVGANHVEKKATQSKLSKVIISYLSQKQIILNVVFGIATILVLLIVPFKVPYILSVILAARVFIPSSRELTDPKPYTLLRFLDAIALLILPIVNFIAI